MPRERHKRQLDVWLLLLLSCFSPQLLAGRVGSINSTFPDWSPVWSSCSATNCYLSLSSGFVLNQEANSDCVERKLVTARIDSEQDVELLQDALWGGVWIGLHATSINATSFVWQGEVEPDFLAWDAGEPFTLHGELCVIAQNTRGRLSPAALTLSASDLADTNTGFGKWATANCQNSFPFVCHLPAGAPTTGCAKAVPLANGSGTYCLAEDLTATWQGAAELCASTFGGRLAHVGSASDLTDLMSTFSLRGDANNMATMYWIGAYNRAVIQPSMADNCNNPSDGGTASCYNGGAECYAYRQDLERLIVRTCDRLNVGLCSAGPNTPAPEGYKEQRGNITYYFMAKPRPFSNALATCRALGGSLAVPEDLVEYQWLVQTGRRYMRNQGFYVGLLGDGARVEGGPAGRVAQFWGGGLSPASPPAIVGSCMALGGWSNASGHWWEGAWWPEACTLARPFVCRLGAAPSAAAAPSLTAGVSTPFPHPATPSSRPRDHDGDDPQLLVPVLVAAVGGMIFLGCLMTVAFIYLGRPSAPKPPKHKPSTASLLWVWFSRRPKHPPKALLPLRLHSVADSAPINSQGPRSLRSPLSSAHARSPYAHSPTASENSSSGGSAGRTRGGSPTPLSSDHSSGSAAAAAAIFASNARGGGGSSAAAGGRSLTAALAAARGGALGSSGPPPAAAAGAAGAAEEEGVLGAVAPVTYRPEGGGLRVYTALPDVLAVEAAAGADSGAAGVVVLDSDPMRADVALNLAIGKQVAVQFDQVLGRGSSGAVYRGLYGGRPVAVKVLDSLWLDGPREGAARVGAPATARDLRRRLSAMSASASASQGGGGGGGSAPPVPLLPPSGESSTGESPRGPSLFRWYADQQRDRGRSAIPPAPSMHRPTHSRDAGIHSPTSIASAGSLSFLRPPSVPFSAPSPTSTTPQHQHTPPAGTPPASCTPPHAAFTYPVPNPLYSIQASPPHTPTSGHLSNSAPAPTGPLPSHTLGRGAPAAAPPAGHAPAVPSITRQSLQQEVAILSRVRHPNVIELLGGGLQAREAFLVMELMDCNLGTYVRRRGRLPAVEALSVVRSVAKGLWHLHPTIMHRDLKPENILLNDQGTVKIADFGMSRCKVGTMLFTDHLVAGTVPYMAPECYTGEAASEKADIFSLGIILWFCLTGRKPWAGWNSVAIMYQVGHMHQRPPLPTDAEVCPPEVADLIKACWAADPRVRPPAIEVMRRCTTLIATLPAPIF